MLVYVLYETFDKFVIVSLSLSLSLSLKIRDLASKPLNVFFLNKNGHWGQTVMFLHIKYSFLLL